MNQEILNNRIKAAEKRKEGYFDVFISYNHQDREQVLNISKLLRDNGITPFLDQWDLQPGLPWQVSLEEQIKTVKSAAIFVGEAGMSFWHRKEMNAFEREFEKRKLPVIPVLLPDISSTRELPSFLEEMTWVDFRKRYPDPLDQLIWGITGEHPEKIYRPGVLIASLGDSPVVVSSMYELLKEREELTIERIEVLRPNDDEARSAYGLVKDALIDAPELKLSHKLLGFKDADSWTNACLFLQELYALLSSHQKQGDSVYLSLAGGRKSMAALMAWVAPFFSCVKGLYHVLDKEEENLLTADEIKKEAKANQFQKMHPDLDQLVLVEIPFERGRHISAKLDSFIGSSSDTDYEEEEARITGRTIVQQEGILRLYMTDLALAQFHTLCHDDLKTAQAVHTDLLQMHHVVTLESCETDTYAYPPKVPKKRQVQLQSFIGSQTSIRPIFYTKPAGIYGNSDERVEEIVVCSLEAAGNSSDFRSLKKVAAAPDFSIEPAQVLPPVPFPIDSILIVPLGQSPMVVTQLFTLLWEQERHTIHEVILIYPRLATKIDNSAKLLKQALTREYNVLCTLVPLSGLEDITSKEDCEAYQEQLKREIARVQQEHPKMKIDLALSGGRKGMTAMTISAAQKNHIPYVYHTLITDDATNDAIDQETSYDDLIKTDLSSDERQDRLFLRAYRAEGPNPYAHFALFRVPVFFAEESEEPIES